MKDEKWLEIVLDIQEIVTLAGADPDKADKKKLAALTVKMEKYAASKN